MGLIGVTALGRHEGRGVSGGQLVSSVIEADELTGSLWSTAHLLAEAGPQPLSAPSELLSEVLHSDLAPVREDLSPGIGNFGVDSPAASATVGKRAIDDGKALVPRRRLSESFFEAGGIAPPEVFQRDDSLTEFPAGAQHAVGHQRREPHLETLDATTPNPNGSLGQANSDTALLCDSTAILHDEAVTKVYA